MKAEYFVTRERSGDHQKIDDQEVNKRLESQASSNTFDDGMKRGHPSTAWCDCAFGQFVGDRFFHKRQLHVSVRVFHRVVAAASPCLR